MINRVCVFCGSNDGGREDYRAATVRERFVQPEHRAMVLVEEESGAPLSRFAGNAPPAVSKWIDRSAT